jgi:hypothetical protein
MDRTKLNLDQIRNSQTIIKSTTLSSSNGIRIDRTNPIYELDNRTYCCFLLNGDRADLLNNSHIIQGEVDHFTNDDPWYSGYSSAVLKNRSGSATNFYNYNTDTNPGTTKDFTIEFRFNQDVSSGEVFIGLGEISFYFAAGAAGTTIKNGSSVVYNDSTSIASEWHHYAVSRASGETSVYIDGTRVYNTSNTLSLSVLCIANADSELKNKYAQIAHFTYARWTGASFTVPTHPYTIADDQLSLSLTGPSIVEDLSSSTITLTTTAPNTIYKYGELTALTISGITVSNDATLIYFTAGTSFALTLPSTYSKIGDLTFEDGKKYVICIFNGIICRSEITDVA